MSSSGTLFGLASGAVTTTATSGDVSDSTSVEVTDSDLVGLIVAPATVVLPNGGVQQFNAIGTYSDGTTGDVTASATWSSSAAEIAATVEGTPGLVQSAQAGESTITAQLDGVDAGALLTVSNAELLALHILPTESSLLPSADSLRHRQWTASDRCRGPERRWIARHCRGCR